MKSGAAGSFGAQLKALREAAGFTQEELATIAGLSVHAVSALERGQRRKPRLDTVRALSAALDLDGPARDALLSSARAADAHASSGDPIDSTLPLPPTALLGRDAELRTLRGWLADPAVRLVTLTGPGGAGKTRLALELTREVAADAATHVVFVPLAAIRNPADVAPAIAEALGLSDVTALDWPRAAVAACAERPTLLVLDNFEQVAEAAPLVAALLGSAAPLRVLTTSRAPLRVRGEREHAVGPLALEAEPDALSTPDRAVSPAVRLFVDRVCDLQPEFQLTPENLPTVRSICRRLDALPLALELAAPWLKILTPADLLGLLERDVLFSASGPRDLPERQRTMNATVAWSYQLLCPTEQRAFRRCAALPGRFPLEAAAAVLAGSGSAPEIDETLDLVAALIDKSLLQRVDSATTSRPLYEMLETVRAYGGHALAAAGERDDAFEGLARYCIAESALVAEGLVGRAQIEWLDCVRDDLANYRGGLAWLIEQGRAEAADIASRLLFFWVIRGHAAEGIRWLEGALGLPSLPPDVRSRALTSVALLSYTQGDLERARVMLDGALAAGRGSGDPEAVVRAEWGLGHIENALGNLGEARRWFTRCIAGFKAAGNPWGAGNALSGLAWVALAAGDAGEAERLLDDAGTVLQHAGSWFMLIALYVRANLAVRRGNADEAIGWVRESLVRIKALRDKFAIVYVLVPFAAAAVLKGDDAWAARILGARDAVTARSGATVADNSVRDIREKTEREAPERLGPVRWAKEYAAGRSASIDTLIREIDGVRA